MSNKNPEGREQNMGLIASFVTASSEREFRDIPLNRDLFNKMALPACFNQCAKTDIDIVYLNEMECTYKCMITYKQSLGFIRELDHL